MIPLLLAATIAGSVPGAVERYLSQLPQDDPAVLRASIAELRERVELNERIRDDTLSCISESLIATGADLGTTGLAWDRCPTCQEANPLGLNAEARTGLKFAQTGAEVGLCLLAAKHRHSAEDTSQHRHGKWIARSIRVLIVLNNSYAVIKSKPLLKWGTK